MAETRPHWTGASRKPSFFCIEGIHRHTYRHIYIHIYICICYVYMYVTSRYIYTHLEEVQAQLLLLLCAILLQHFHVARVRRRAVHRQVGHAVGAQDLCYGGVLQHRKLGDLAAQNKNFNTFSLQIAQKRSYLPTLKLRSRWRLYTWNPRDRAMMQSL